MLYQQRVGVMTCSYAGGAVGPPGHGSASGLHTPGLPERGCFGLVMTTGCAAPPGRPCRGRSLSFRRLAMLGLAVGWRTADTPVPAR